MIQPRTQSTPRPTRVDPRDLARRVVAVVVTSAGVFGILAGRPLLAVLARAGAVACAGVLLIAVTEAVVRRAKRRVVR